MRWLPLLLFACGAPPPLDTPVYILPDERAALDALATAELARWRRELDERFTEALDPGEAAEHARRVTQTEIESGSADLAAIFLQGETLFERRFTRVEGLGTGRLERPAPAHARVQNPAILGGPDAIACKDCHFRGGDDGHGELHQRAWLDGDGRHLSSATPRVPPMLAGLGLVQGLAREMTAEIAKQVADFQAARRAGLPGEGRLRIVSKGVEFGTIRVAPDGTLDTAGLIALEPDLVVRPFGWQGRHPDLRSFIREAFPQHIGLEPVPLPTDAAAEAARPRDGRPLDSRVIDLRAGLFDQDADQVAAELRDGQLTSMAVYLALLDAPRVLPPRSGVAKAAWSRGNSLFDSVGCAECHRRTLPLNETTQTEGPADRPPFRYDLVADVQVPPGGERFPPPLPGRPLHALQVPLFSDLRRHDLGLAERGRLFMTRPLWGLGDRGPYYLHDGRARSLAEAIRAHGGEAAAVRDAWAALPEADRRALDVFLSSLRRQPQGRFSL